MLKLLLLALIPTAAFADDPALPGFRFDLMPVGCKIFGRFSDVGDVVQEYVGIRDGDYIMTTSDAAGNLVRTNRYDVDGWMVRKDWADGFWETYTPHSCFTQIGECSYVYNNSDGERGAFKGEVSGDKSRILSTGGFVGAAPFSDTVLTLDHLNLIASYSDNDRSFRITRYQDCDLTLPSS